MSFGKRIAAPTSSWGATITRTRYESVLHETSVKFCQEILLELFGTEWMLVAGLSDCVASVEDLCIWDFASSEAPIPHDLELPKPRKQWFVVRRKDLRALQEVGGAADLGGLLKPVTRGALGAFLSGASPEQNEQNDASAGLAGALRVQRDAMLQLLVQSNLRLQENDHDRNNFLARSVHDFRAPLTAISGYCGLLLEEEFGPLTPEQQKVAAAYIQQLDAAHVFHAKIVTQLVHMDAFYDGEDYHQDYAEKNPDNPYIQVCDVPKIAGLKEQFPELFQDYKHK